MLHSGFLILGHMALDGVARGAHILREGEVEVTVASRRFIVRLIGGAVCRSKPYAAIPDDLWRLAADVKAGGGGPNSARAAGLMDFRRIFYLESCQEEALLTRSLAYPHVTVRHLGLRRAPRNLVLDAVSERLICRSRLEAAEPLGKREASVLAEYLRCRCTLANSIKDVEIAERVAAAAHAGTTELVWVLTSAFQPDFHQRVMMPAATILIVSADEVACCSGEGVPMTVEGALDAVDTIRGFAPRVIVLVTLGGDGVVASAPRCGALHIRLSRSSAAWALTEGLVAADAACLTGAGDAFAAGAAYYRAFGRSLLPWLGAPSAEGAALAGCALAVRWIGRLAPLTRSDFDLRVVAPPGFRVAA